MVSDGRSTPHPRRARLARHLRLLREDSGLTIETVGRRLGWSGSKLSRIETSLTGVTPSDAARLLDLYKVVSPRRDWLLAMARSGAVRSMLGAYPELGRVGGCSQLRVECRAGHRADSGIHPSRRGISQA
ncbi:hypothetical protein Lfu02_32120 [Longispora fulva]|uniref:AraC-like DNA-binding protein n=1 Tax=Longispora fulva TaxID=619741 RepID=A0A8J7GM36_9ACTN|nr:helix-turn-helix transcriptional regulator [Longispora fulva]MBG6139343.1 AraC-like DNA-binding protein [Longispora fulva]GIG58840.1 hypothetical protein Lfu02_32120 [Longispora fulva]